jgi:hypothetical protein
MKNKSIASEYQEQCLVFAWAKLNQIRYPLIKYMHCSLEGELTALKAKKMSKAGLTKGVPDIFLPVSNLYFSGLFIELKRKGGKISLEQIETINFYNTQGFRAIVCYGADEAIKEIKEYLTKEIKNG